MESVSQEKLQTLITQGNVVWKEHALQRMALRMIGKKDVKDCIMNGEIIENYMDDYPVPSCLIMGKTQENRFLHVVCSIHEEKVCIITAYFPDRDRWEDDLKTRKEIK